MEEIYIMRITKTKYYFHCSKLVMETIKVFLTTVIDIHNKDWIVIATSSINKYTYHVLERNVWKVRIHKTMEKGRYGPMKEFYGMKRKNPNCVFFRVPIEALEAQFDERYIPKGMASNSNRLHHGQAVQRLWDGR